MRLPATPALNGDRMTIEGELFAKYSFDDDKLVAYGFERDCGRLVYTASLPGFEFEAAIVYDVDITGMLIDLDTGEEYTNFRMEQSKGFSAQVRQSYIDLLMDIRRECCKNQFFDSTQAQRINQHIFETFGCTSEFLWPNIPSYAAFRREGNKKWFAVMETVPRNKIDHASASDVPVEVVNVKVDPAELVGLLAKPGYYPAFHMKGIVADGETPQSFSRSGRDRASRRNRDRDRAPSLRRRFGNRALHAPSRRSR